MLHIITGGSGSGKSSYAEEEILRLAGAEQEELKKYYIATMEPFGKETLRKIQRHQNMRAGKGFQTVECYTDLAKAARGIAEASAGEKQAVLLECMSNLTANEYYRRGGSRQDIAERIVHGVKALCSYNAYVVIVTNEVCSDCTEYSEEMQEYRKLLAAINCLLGEMADRVTEVVYGIPVEVKR